MSIQNCKDLVERLEDEYRYEMETIVYTNPDKLSYDSKVGLWAVSLTGSDKSL
jgi:hypothetical protein